LALVAIKNKNVPLHRKLMSTALVLSVLFLLSYVAYHLTTESTKYGGEGFLRSLYYFILISHIVLSAAIVPLVLISYVRALASRFDKHKKIARITMPLWIYVAVTGVLVYVMISPYYPFNQ
jgi:putative membrane protein